MDRFKRLGWVRQGFGFKRGCVREIGTGLRDSGLDGDRLERQRFAGRNGLRDGDRYERLGHVSDTGVGF